ncbi:MAG: TIGR03905 family TSCPD domain-containing protein [Deltaproteobacteria bacterium]|nr:TIGR03905 family TSCPD domain-containing protein [Deltaproteobacteria bacterium]
MKRTFTFTPAGVCSTGLKFEIDGDIVRSIRFAGGCPGNLQAVAKLAEGRPAAEIVKLLEGIKCGEKPTSCSDQLARALKKAFAGTA